MPQRDLKRESLGSLRMAFIDEIRPAEYMGRIIMTSAVVAFVLAANICLVEGQFHLDYVFPAQLGLARDPRGVLYLETWANLIVNAFQAGFILWSIVLLVLGIKRILASHKYVWGFFFLSFAFAGFALSMPNLAELIVAMIVEKFPQLAI